MSLLNKTIITDYGGRDENQLALDIMDKILIVAPAYVEFRLSDLISKIESKDHNANIIISLNSKIDNLQTKTFNYANRPQPSQYSISLTEKGRLVKSQGGHLEYTRKIADKVSLEKERQELTDEKLRLDVRNSRRIYKTYWVTFTFALISFVYIVIQIILKIVE